MVKDSHTDDVPEIMLKDNARDNKRLNDILSFVRVKIERLTVATYRVSDFLNDAEPLKRRLREYALKTLTESGREDALSVLSPTLRTMTLLCDTASVTRVGSTMNFSILSDEYSSLITLISDELLIPSLSGVKEVYLSSFTVPVPQIQAVPYKGHQKDIKDKEIKNGSADRSDRIIAYIKDHPGSGIKVISKLFPGVSEKTVQRELLTLVSRGILQKEGERRWSRYSLKTG